MSKKCKLYCGELAQNMRRPEICCLQSDTSFYQSVLRNMLQNSVITRILLKKMFVKRMWENSWRWQTRSCEYCEKKLRFGFIDEVILNEKTCNVTCTEHKKGLKFVAHKIIILTISPFLQNMWQKSVSDFLHEISHEWRTVMSEKRKL